MQQVFHPKFGSGQLDCVIKHPHYPPVGIVKIEVGNGFKEYRRAPLDEWRVLVRGFIRRTRVRAE